MPDDDPASGGLTTTGVISRRNLIIAATAGGVGLSELVSALGDDDGTGLISGGIMALAQAYNVAGDLYVGPYSARNDVAADSGRVYIASDREELLYGDSGSWVSLGTIGALTDTQTNNPDGGDVYQLPQAEDSVDLQGSGEVTDADLLEGHVFDLAQQADDGSDRVVVRGSDGNPKAEVYFDGTDTVINPLTGSVSVPGALAADDLVTESTETVERTVNDGVTDTLRTLSFPTQGVTVPDSFQIETAVGTSATTIITMAGPANGGVFLVVGASGSADRFVDLVSSGRDASGVDVINSLNLTGSPAARSYSTPSFDAALKLAMASGTYGIGCRGWEMVQ